MSYVKLDIVVTNCLLAVLAIKLRVCLVSYFAIDVVLLSPQRSSELLLLKPRIFFCMRYFSYLCFHRCPARILSRERGESLPVTYQNYWCMLIMWSRPENWWWEIVSKSILTCCEWILFAGYQPDFQQYYWHLWVLCYVAGFVGGSNWSCRWRQTASNWGMLWRNGRGMKC